MPLPRRHSCQVGKRNNDLIGLGENGSVLDARIQLSPLHPDHGRGHPIVASRVIEVGDELRNVVPLTAAEVPVFLQAEGEAVEAGVPLAVDVVFAQVGVIAISVVWIINLSAFDSGGRLVEDVGHLLYSAMVVLTNVGPAGGSALYC